MSDTKNVATDAEVAKVKNEVCLYEDDDFCRDVQAILNRLSLAESRLAELEKEVEWARLLYEAQNVLGGFRAQMGGDRMLWLVPKDGSDDAICIGPYTGKFPTRPSDDIVAKIRASLEAING